MSQDSFFWTTDDTGDGAASGYTQTEYSRAFEALAACSGFEGVAPGYLNELECTANGANTVAVNTGGALVDGKPYYNSASVDVNVPSASGAGNTRIDRIVLRASWAAQTVRITRIAGTDAASPSAPALTQTSGTTYDLSLCTVLVNTGGTVTVTDARTWAQGDDNSLSAGAVTTVKLAARAVTSAKLQTAAVVTVKLNDAAVTSAKIATGGVPNAKLPQRGGPALIARTQSGAGAMEDIVAAAGGQVCRVTVAGVLGFGTITAEGVGTSAITTVKLNDAAVTSAKVATGAIVAAKLGADSVTGTAAGNRVVVLDKRQGGSATNWALSGTTAYTPGAVRMQVGSLEMGNSGTWTVTFPVAFSDRPIVTFNTYKGDILPFGTGTPTASGFSVVKPDITPDILFWIAIGPEA